MAKALFGNIIVSLRGSIAGNTYSQNSSGQYVRAKTSPVQPSTPAQQLQKQNLTNVTQSWRGLTQAERDQWIQAAPIFNNNNVFGNNVPLTAQQLFMRLNLNLLSIAQPVITVPPVPTAVFGFTALSLAANTTGGSLDATFAPVIPVGTSIVVRSTTQLSAGIQFAKNFFRKIGTIDSTDLSPLDIAVLYTTKFGALPVIGTKVFVDMRAVDNATGIDSTLIEASDIAF